MELCKIKVVNEKNAGGSEVYINDMMIAGVESVQYLESADEIMPRVVLVITPGQFSAEIKPDVVYGDEPISDEDVFEFVQMLRETKGAGIKVEMTQQDPAVPDENPASID